jgi:hypothetical protein
MAKTIQDQLAERIKTKFPSAEVKKVNKDNFLDIHLPSVHPKRGTHLFFNTSGGSIKLGFYCREEDFTKQVLAKSTDVEAYSQGVRPKGNPEWKSVDAAGTAALAFLESLGGKGKKEQAPSTKEAPKPKKETPRATTSKAEDLSDFDLTEFDLEGRAVGKKDAPKASSQKEKPELDLNTFDLSTFGLEGEPAPKTPAANLPKGKPADLSQVDESDRCLDDPQAFLTCVQQVRNYYLGLSPKSKTYRGAYEETLREYTKAAVVPRITNEMLRFAHEDGNLIEALLLGPMLKAEQIYDKTYATHTEYICGLGKGIDDLLKHCNEGLFLDTLEFFMYLGDMLEESESYGGSLAPQDRYFPLFLMLKARPELDVDNIEEVLKKNAHTRFAKYGIEVNALLLKASGNFSQLSNEEKLGLILYDFILWDEPDAGLDIKLMDKNAARAIFTLITQNAPLGEKLVGGFKDNASYEVFQFFNVEYNRAGFHTFCLERWKELSSEWNPLKLQLLLDRVKRDFHISTYTNNPVLKDYLKIYEGVRVLDLSESTTSELAEMIGEKETKEAAAPKKQKAVPKAKEKKRKDPFTLDKSKKTLDITSLPHCILFVILQVGWKLDNYTAEELADIKSTAVTMGEWFDLDQDECLEVLDETLDLLKQCKGIFDIKELANLVSENCIVINMNISSEGVREDIIRFMNDLANADGKVTEEEEINLNYYSILIRLGGAMFDEA